MNKKIENLIARRIKTYADLRAEVSRWKKLMDEGKAKTHDAEIISLMDNLLSGITKRDARIALLLGFVAGWEKAGWIPQQELARLVEASRALA